MAKVEVVVWSLFTHEDTYFKTNLSMTEKYTDLIEPCYQFITALRKKLHCSGAILFFNQEYMCVYCL